MPFKSEKQRRFLYAKHPEIAKRFAEHTPTKDTKKKLPLYIRDEVKEGAVDPALLLNGGLSLAELAGLSTPPLARGALVGAAGAMSADDGGDRAMHGMATGVGAAGGRVLADALHAAALEGSFGTWVQGRHAIPVVHPLLRAGLGTAGTLGGRMFARHLDAERQGQRAALEAYGAEKVAFNFGGMARGAMAVGGKALGMGSKALGFLPTGIGNLAAGGLGALGGVMEAKAQGKGFTGMLAHGAAGALGGIPGGAGMAASMGAGMLAQNIGKPVAPPGAPAVGQMLG